MRVLQSSCHYSHIHPKYIEQALCGKWYQLKPRTFIAKGNDQFMAVSFNCLERLAAAFLKIFQVDYFKRILNVREFRLINPRKEKPQPIPAQTPAVYNLDHAIEQVRRQTMEVARENKRHCLFLCRSLLQSVPQNPNEVWVTLDNEYGRAYSAPADRRIHLKMDINDERLGQLTGLFDRVILDQASFNALGHDFPWLTLRSLLKKTPDAELITETFRHSEPRIYRDEDQMRLEQNPPPFTSRELFIKERQALISFPIVVTWDAAQKATAKRNAAELAIHKIQQYLQTIFTRVERRQQSFPFAERLVDHFVMKGPIAHR